MDKETYLKVRGELNFAPSPSMLRKHLVQDCMMVAAIAWMLKGGGLLGYLASQALLAFIYFRGFGMMHEAVHGSLSENPRVNKWLGVVYGGVCFLPFTTWRSLHLDHHAWVGNAEQDPVMRLVRDFPNKSTFRQKVDSILWRSWIPYMAFLQEILFWTASAKLVVKKEAYKGKRSELVASVITPSLMFAVVAGVGLALGNLFFLLPSVVAYLTLVEVINFPHHLGLPRIAGETKLSLWDQYKVSRTCVYSAWFSRFVLLNFNFHAEHHMFPTLPWFELAVAHAKIKAHQPPDYEMCEGHEWIMANRQKNLKEVLAPAKILAPENAPQREVA